MYTGKQEIRMHAHCMHIQTHTYRHIWTKRTTTTTKKTLLCMMHSDIFFCVLYILFYLILTNHIVEKLIILLFVSWQSPLPHGTRECYTNFRISSSGTFRRTRTAASHIWALPLHVPNHCVWKPAHHLGHQLRLPPPHPHVLLPLQPVLCRPLFHLHHHP